MEIEQYRGARGLLIKELGDEGLIELHRRSHGSPTLAGEFLGYTGSTTVRRHWKRLGLASRLSGSRLSMDPLMAGEELQSVTDIREMYLTATSRADLAPVYEWKVPRDTEYAHLVFLGDLHYGSPEMDYRRLIFLCDWIAEHPDVRWIGMGDYWDLVTMQSPGVHRQSLTYDQATDLIRDDTAPIMDQCLMLHRGNHDERIMKGLQIGHDPVKKWANESNVPYGGYSGFINITVTAGRKSRTQGYTGFQHHGFGSGTTWGYVLNSMERLASQNDCDWVAMGHRHQRASVDISKSRVEDGKVVIYNVPLIATGSFQKHLKDGYSSKKGMRPASLGAASAHLYLDRHSVHGRV